MYKRTNLKNWVVISAFLVVLLAAANAAGRTIYVDDDGPADFSSISIQAAIDSAIDGDIVEVHPGTYFENINFNGRNITLRSRDPKNPDTVAATIIDGRQNGSVVTFNSGEDANCVLNGFTITNGSSGAGGGIYCRKSSPTIMNNIIIGNVSEYDGDGGGGIACFYGSSPQIINNIITKNVSERGGGGIRCYDTDSPIISDNLIAGNVAYGSWGGGITTDYSGCPVIKNNTIVGNSAGYGGGMNCWGSAIIKNNIIEGNYAEQRGGGIKFSARTDQKITNNTIVRNRALHRGGGIFCGYGSSSKIENCIIWGNTDEDDLEIVLEEQSNLTINYTDIRECQSRIYGEEGTILNWGEGNICADPLFARNGVFDFDRFVTVEMGGWQCTLPNFIVEEPDYHLQGESPCIDAGDPNYVPEPNETDLDGEPRVIGGRIDMGAYEYSPLIPAEVRIVPRTINLASMGKWLTCYIWLDEDYNVADIDPNSVVLEDEIQAQSLSADEQQQVAIARFSRSELQAILNPLMADQVELTITGQLTNGTFFEGTDVIRVIDKGNKK